MLAGHANAVASALTALQTVAAEAGLVLEPSKCELIVVGGDPSTVDASLFPAGFAVKATAFDLLGAPVGDSTY